MGASGWVYFVPFQVDIAKALQQLREEVFRRGDYFKPDYILQLIDQMKADGRPIFIHCHAGVGRPGTILHLYFLAQGFSLDEAKAKVKTARPQCTLLSEKQRAFLADFASRH
jgi:protein tyrosine phosphatase